MNNDEFYLSKRTRRAMFIFVALLCLVSFLPRIIIYLFPDKPIHITIEEKKIFQNLKYTPTKKFEKKTGMKQGMGERWGWLGHIYIYTYIWSLR